MAHNIESVWNNIKRHQGETFRTVTGKSFEYHVDGNAIKLHNTKRSIPKTNVESALLVPKPSPGLFTQLGFQGPSYLFAIITDERIIK